MAVDGLLFGPRQRIGANIKKCGIIITDKRIKLFTGSDRKGVHMEDREKSELAALAEALSLLADSLNGIAEARKGNVRITDPVIGMSVGKCKNCGSSVIMRQPWLSEEPIVNDGEYLFKCTNEKCHNCYGMELQIEDELGLADFIEWDLQYIKEEEQTASNVIKIDFGKNRKKDAKTRRWQI